MDIHVNGRNDWRKCCVDEISSLRHAMEVINAASMQVALIVDEECHLKGILTDGDVRRAILRGESLETPIANIMHTDPLVFFAEDSRSYVIRRMQKNKIHQAPLLDAEGKILELYLLDELLFKERRSNIVLLMAGGLGTRLRPLTSDIPKPLLKVGDKPIMETILMSFIENGFSKFYFAVNYKSEMIEQYFGDGSRWDVEIHYLYEKKRLGTAGALYLLPKNLKEPIIVMNGDLLTKVDFGELLAHHLSENAIATMGVREYSWQIPYGVIGVEKNHILTIQEKPVHHCYVNAGMYVLSPEAVQYVSSEDYLDMPDLFRSLIAEEKKTTVYPIRGYWMDIGQMDDFLQAQGDYAEIFGEGDSHVSGKEILGNHPSKGRFQRITP